MSLRLLFVTATLVGVCAVLFTADFFTSHRAYLYKLIQGLSVDLWGLWATSLHTIMPSSKELILTPEELSKYDGMKGSKGLYLAILGRVFDVSKGRKHYGPGGGYHFFTGRDASRAFVTGNFKPDGLTDDVSKLTPQDILGLEEWIQFYEKDYKYVGKVSGRFYTKDGKPTKAWLNYEADLKHAKKMKSKEEADSARFPPCNSEWKQDVGGRVWCSKMRIFDFYEDGQHYAAWKPGRAWGKPMTIHSGGISRDWVGVPRMYHQPGKNNARCACVRNTGPPSDAKPNSAHSNRGDLDNPNMKEYANCRVDSESCPIADN